MGTTREGDDADVFIVDVSSWVPIRREDDDDDDDESDGSTGASDGGTPIRWVRTPARGVLYRATRFVGENGGGSV